MCRAACFAAALASLLASGHQQPRAACSHWPASLRPGSCCQRRFGSRQGSGGSGSEAEDQEDALLARLAGDTLMVGFTATPQRHDSKQMGAVFQVRLSGAAGRDMLPALPRSCPMLLPPVP